MNYNLSRTIKAVVSDTISSKEGSELKMMFNEVANRRRSSMKATRRFTQSKHLLPSEQSDLNLKIFEMQKLQQKVKENHHAARCARQRKDPQKQKRSQSYDLSKTDLSEKKLDVPYEVDEEWGITITAPKTLVSKF